MIGKHQMNACLPCCYKKLIVSDGQNACKKDHYVSSDYKSKLKTVKTYAFTNPNKFEHDRLTQLNDKV
jgi:hypothetical protein